MSEYERTFSMHLKSAADGGGFTAIASTADVDAEGEILEYKAFEPLPPMLPIHLFHDFKQLVGSGRPYYRDQKLFIDGTFARTALGQEARSMVADGHLRHMSVVFRNPQSTRGKDGVPRVVKGELVAADLVALPANSQTAILSSRGYTPTDNRIATAESALAMARAAIARLDAEQMLSAKSPDSALVAARALLRETEPPVRNPLRSDRTESNAVHSWPATDNPVLPRGRIVTLGVVQGFRTRYVRGRGLVSDPCEYVPIYELRNGGWNPQREWRRYRDDPNNLEFQGDGTTPNQTIIGEPVTVSRTLARDISQAHDPNWDPDRTTTVKLQPPIDF